ncbi:Putative ribonuclease H protein At1g65750 [Linum perenne]
MRHFLWFVSRNSVLTNVERRRRHIALFATCKRCNTDEESLLHMLRDCHKAREAWLTILPASSTTEFFSLDQNFWWRKYLADQSLRVAFGVMIWILWKQRNDFIFSEVIQAAGQTIQHHTFWVNLINSSMSDARNIINLGACPLRERHIAWGPAPALWTTLNADGSLKKQNNSAAAGGVIRDESGRILAAFATNLGVCSITRAELFSAVKCLELAWDKGCCKVMLQLDSKCAVQILSKPADLDHQHASLVARFNELKQRVWDINIQHIFREANFLADYLANSGHLLPFGTHEIATDDPGVNSWCAYDIARTARSRLVRELM